VEGDNIIVVRQTMCNRRRNKINLNESILHAENR
jgi:hypothetical protein